MKSPSNQRLLISLKADADAHYTASAYGSSTATQYPQEPSRLEGARMVTGAADP